MKKKLLSVLLLILTVFLGGCKEENKIKEVNLTYVTSPLNVPSIIAKEKGIFQQVFEKEGIKVNFVEITSGAQQTQALASGDIHFLYCVGGSPVISSFSNGADIKILNMYSRAPEAFAIISKSTDIKKPSDLIGKTIGAPAGTNAHELLVSYLASEGLKISDVNFVSMGMPNAQSALIGGSIDAAVVAGPIAYSLEKSGNHVVTTGKNYIEAMTAVALTQKFYSENPKIVALFNKAQKEVMTFMDKNPEESLNIAAKTLNMDINEIKDMYKAYNFSTEISPEDIQGLQRTADFMLNNKMIEKGVDVKDVIAK